MQQSLAQIGLAWLLGARFAVLTNAAGGMSPTFAAGDVMVITDSLNLMFRSVQRGWMLPVARNSAENDIGFMRSASGESIFSASWRSKIVRDIAQRGVPFHQGTYCALTGPTFETPAEARAYRLLGGQAIGMSTVHEAEFARVCGMRVAGCSLITNMLPESVASTVSHDEVIHAAAVGAPRIAAFIAAACKTVE
jgi:purine nucleoside phosphorylase